MKTILASKRSIAILAIAIVSIGIGAISKKLISFPSGRCIQETQEFTFEKRINNYIL